MRPRKMREKNPLSILSTIKKEDLLQKLLHSLYTLPMKMQLNPINKYKTLQP